MLFISIYDTKFRRNSEMNLNFAFFCRFFSKNVLFYIKNESRTLFGPELIFHIIIDLHLLPIHVSLPISARSVRYCDG